MADLKGFVLQLRSERPPLVGLPRARKIELLREASAAAKRLALDAIDRVRSRGFDVRATPQDNIFPVLVIRASAEAAEELRKEPVVESVEDEPSIGVGE